MMGFYRGFLVLFLMCLILKEAVCMKNNHQHEKGNTKQDPTKEQDLSELKELHQLVEKFAQNQAIRGNKRTSTPRTALVTSPVVHNGKTPLSSSKTVMATVPKKRTTSGVVNTIERLQNAIGVDAVGGEEDQPTIMLEAASSGSGDEDGGMEEISGSGSGSGASKEDAEWVPVILDEGSNPRGAVTKNKAVQRNVKQVQKATQKKTPATQKSNQKVRYEQKIALTNTKMSSPQIKTQTMNYANIHYQQQRLQTNPLNAYQNYWPQYNQNKGSVKTATPKGSGITAIRNQMRLNVNYVAPKAQSASQVQPQNSVGAIQSAMIQPAQPKISAPTKVLTVRKETSKNKIKETKLSKTADGAEDTDEDDDEQKTIDLLFDIQEENHAGQKKKKNHNKKKSHKKNKNAKGKKNKTQQKSSVKENKNVPEQPVSEVLMFSGKNDLSTKNVDPLVIKEALNIFTKNSAKKHEEGAKTNNTSNVVLSIPEKHVKNLTEQNTDSGKTIILAVPVKLTDKDMLEQQVNAIKEKLLALGEESGKTNTTSLTLKNDRESGPRLNEKEPSIPHLNEKEMAGPHLNEKDASLQHSKEGGSVGPRLNEKEPSGAVKETTKDSNEVKHLSTTNVDSGKDENTKGSGSHIDGSKESNDAKQSPQFTFPVPSPVEKHLNEITENPISSVNTAQPVLDELKETGAEIAGEDGREKQSKGFLEAIAKLKNKEQQKVASTNQEQDGDDDVANNQPQTVPSNTALSTEVEDNSDESKIIPTESQTSEASKNNDEEDDESLSSASSSQGLSNKNVATTGYQKPANIKPPLQTNTNARQGAKAAVGTLSQEDADEDTEEEEGDEDAQLKGNRYLLPGKQASGHRASSSLFKGKEYKPSHIPVTFHKHLSGSSHFKSGDFKPSYIPMTYHKHGGSTSKFKGGDYKPSRIPMTFKNIRHDSKPKDNHLIDDDGCRVSCKRVCTPSCRFECCKGGDKKTNAKNVGKGLHSQKFNTRNVGKHLHKKKMKDSKIEDKVKSINQKISKLLKKPASKALAFKDLPSLPKLRKKINYDSKKGQKFLKETQKKLESLISLLSKSSDELNYGPRTSASKKTLSCDAECKVMCLPSCKFECCKQ
eukprot:TCONS_00005853-protein